MRILHITPYYEPAWAYGGSPRIAVELCRRMAASDHDVTVLTTDALDATNRVDTHSEIIDDVAIIRVPNWSNNLAWRRVFLPRGYSTALRAIIDRVDVVHIHEIRSFLNSAALPILTQTETPFVIMPHGGLPRELGRSPFKTLYDALWGNRLLESACRLHALTDMEREQYLAMGIDSARVVQIPNGIDLNEADIETDTAAFRQRFDIPADAPVIAFLGRLNDIKGLDVLIEAFADLLTTHPHSMLVLAGPDDGVRPALESQVAALRIGDSVRFTGMLTDPNDKAAVYRMASAYALPSRYENLPTTILEALLNGTPCLLSDRCGLAAQLDAADVATILPYGDVIVWANAMRTVLNEPEASQAQARQGRAYVESHFASPAIIQRWLDVYAACLA